MVVVAKLLGVRSSQVCPLSVDENIPEEFERNNVPVSLKTNAPAELDHGV